jgi:hypothetical protein
MSSLILDTEGGINLSGNCRGDKHHYCDHSDSYKVIIAIIIIIRQMMMMLRMMMMIIIIRL